ncbi:hypothetical protein P153DRAFT_82117 [Dothidotthia symphoricarpi CBS 119687]|uniref:Uncharacterized protein n=1 Tax=Dothidotthia symphoricarpi CBS 119687 TaxID=1392245 RepID=A0A6A6A4C7_9PLEO|nr:uncharacterized protein P153DRAFT_82117 [Dothidotthia symphoricarpi CBS 119687]KAF2126660.1 hypothetical protein P153DRAFT_82117 [Dothidotthia symphoricarpi CBS 119687]
MLQRGMVGGEGGKLMCCWLVSSPLDFDLHSVTKKRNNRRARLYGLAGGVTTESRGYISTKKQQVRKPILKMGRIGEGSRGDKTACTLNIKIGLEQSIKLKAIVGGLGNS